MALDNKYVLAPSLQMYFVGKDNGLPLDGGFVYFYEDGTNIPKDVYELSGSADSDYSFTVLPNPVELSAVGTFQDGSGNDILPYYYPYDDSGNIQLYTIVVTDKDGALQFTRNAWPNLVAGDVIADQDVTNFVANGQFLTHDNIPATSANGYVAGRISQDSTAIAPGGWYFLCGPTSTATNTVTFNSIGATNIPTGNPPFEVQISSNGGTDTLKDLRLRFLDVNRFASETLQYNLYFEAHSVGSSIPNVQIYIIQNYGSGGSTERQVTLPGSPITLTTAYQSFNTTLSFPVNTGKTIGDFNYVDIAIRLPPTATQTAIFTNFCITVNNAILNAFPTQTNAQQLSQAMAGYLPTPDPDGFDAYLPIVNSPTGFVFDRSVIGEIVAVSNTSDYTGSVNLYCNKLLCDGAQYKSSDYSPLGIPYARLGDYYLAGGSGNVPEYGTGSNFATAYISSGVAPQKIILTLNKVGSQTAPANGGVSPTFTFTNLITGSAGFGFVAASNGSTFVTAISTAVGASLGSVAAGAGTSGMVVNDVRNNAATYYAFNLVASTAAALGNGGGAGKYFTFRSTATSYYMWFQTATETDPAPGGTGIKLILDLNMTAADVAKVIANALSGFQEYQITCVAGSSVPAGSYFTFTANSQVYVVWFSVSGSGSQPVVANAIYIPVSITTAMTNAQVAAATQLAINSTYFAVPNLTGLFLRGRDTTGEWDINYASRTSNANTLTSGAAGTFELDSFSSHIHAFSLTITEDGTTDSTIGAGGGGSKNPYSGVTQSTGSGENIPVNSSVIWAVKY